MAIYLATGYTTSSKKEQTLASASASGGNYYSGNNTNVITCSTAWNLAGFDTLTLTWQNDMRVGYWTNPAGSYTNSTRYSYLVFADDTELLLGTSTAQTTQTVDLAKYTDTQKASVTLRGKLDYYLSTTTNATTYGGITASDVIAVGSTSGGTTYDEIGKLYEVGGSDRSQISKVYDWNGSAMSLIYSSEFVFYNYGECGTEILTFKNLDNSVAAVQNDYINLRAECRYGITAGRVAAYSEEPLELSQYSKVTIVLNGGAADGGWTNLAFSDSNCICAAFSATPGGNLGSLSGDFYAVKNLNMSEWGQENTIRTVEWDISELTGSYHFNLMARAYQTYSYANWMKIHSVIFE